MANKLYGSRERMRMEYQSQQRAVIVALALVAGQKLTTSQVAEMAGLTYSGARHLMEAISGERVPIYRDEETGRWAIVRD